MSSTPELDGTSTAFVWTSETAWERGDGNWGMMVRIGRKLTHVVDEKPLSQVHSRTSLVAQKKLHVQAPFFMFSSAMARSSSGSVPDLIYATNIQDDILDEQTDQHSSCPLYLDPTTQAHLDDTAQLACCICRTAIGGVAFLSGEGGVTLHGWSPTGRFTSAVDGLVFCEVLSILTIGHTLGEAAPDGLVAIPDIEADQRFRSVVAGRNGDGLGVRSYATVPIHTTGESRACLFVMEHEPRLLDEGQRKALLMLAKQVATHLGMQREVLALRQANAQLRRSNLEKNTLLGVVSHDLRQPLSNLMMCSELLHEDKSSLTCEQADLLNTADSCVLSMHHLVDDLLRFVESDYGKRRIALDSRLTDMVQLVQRVVSINLACASRKNISIRMSIRSCQLNEPDSQTRHSLSREDDVHDLEQPAIMCNIDPDRMEQVINNLLSNAIKYTNPGGRVTVIVGETTLDDTFTGVGKHESCAYISIEDSGVGIPRYEMDKLFRPFSRLSVRPTAGESSTGLGLAIVRNIVAAHRGEVQVESEVGKGSIFRVLLPLPNRTRAASPTEQ